MKKIFVLFLTIFAMACFSMPAFAKDTSNCDTISLDSNNKADVSLSANVCAKYITPTTGASYSAATYNDKGVGRCYGTASDTTYILYNDTATGVSLAGLSVINTNGDSRDVSGDAWHQLGKE